MTQHWLRVTVHPKAKKELLLQHGPDRFEAWVRAAPIEGRANEAVINLLSRALKTPHDRLRLTKGRSGRHKVFRIIQ